MSVDMICLCELEPFAERTELAEIALSCMCTLLTEVTHFNFSVNLISCIVARLSRRSWDKVRVLFLRTHMVPADDISMPIIAIN